MEDYIAEAVRETIVPDLLADVRNLAADRAGIDSLVVIYNRCGQTFFDYAGETPLGVVGMVERASRDFTRQLAKDERAEAKLAII